MTDQFRPVGWDSVRLEEVAAVNEALQQGEPTVDVAIYYPNNLDPRHHEKVNLDLLFEGFANAKDIFATAGVQLRLVDVSSGPLDPSLFMIRASKPGRDLPMGHFTNMYTEAERHPSELTEEAMRVFESVIGDVARSDRTVHIVVLQGVFIDHYDPVVETRVYQKQTIETSGLSFPGYMHGDRIPRPYRGVITITNLRRTKDSWKTIAHELGHKLMNVSHEHRDVSPAHEIQSDEGLMLYGAGTEIARGDEGRFHHERLHRSPFIYRESDGHREYNPDYRSGGFYYDPIYDGVSVMFAPEA